MAKEVQKYIGLVVHTPLILQDAHANAFTSWSLVFWAFLETLTLPDNIN